MKTLSLVLKSAHSLTSFSFGATGIISCIIGYFVLPEIACRTPAEIDEMFEDKVPPRKFRKHVTQVQIFFEGSTNKVRDATEEKA